MILPKSESPGHPVSRPLPEESSPLSSENDHLTFRRADFGSLAEALDYAARGETGLSFYGSDGTIAQAMSYTNIRRRARAMARRLKTLGVQRGEAVAIVAEVGSDFVCGFFACQYAGVIAIPLPVLTSLGMLPGYRHQIRQIVTSSGARVILGPTTFLQKFQPMFADLGLAAILDTDQLIQVEAADGPLTPLGKDDPSHIQYSSGSTRQPTGILISQRALMANAKSVACNGLMLRKGDRAASWLPFYHDMGLIGMLLIPTACQVSVDFMRPDQFGRRPLQWLRIISANRSTISYSPAFGYELCVRRACISRELDLDLSNWRIAGVGGEMIRPAPLLEFSNTFARSGFRSTAFLPSYGLAEATLAVSFSQAQAGFTVDHVDRTTLVERGRAVPAVRRDGRSKLTASSLERSSFVMCGKPLPGYQVEVRNAKGRSLGKRVVGTVHVRAPSLMAGYWKRAGSHANPVDKEGWLDTGDMGYFVDGNLVVTGRRKDLIICNGRNLWPQDLEWHVEEHVEGLGSRATAAFSVDGPDGQEQIVMLVECRKRGGVVLEELVRKVRSVVYRFAGVNCRPVLVAPNSLLFTSSGKLRRAKLKEVYLDGTLNIITPAQPVQETSC